MTSLRTSSRLDGTPEYDKFKKDDRSIIGPGYEVGGPLFSDRLWLFSSYIPLIDTTNRTTTFTGRNPGPRRLTQSFVQHNMYTGWTFAPLTRCACSPAGTMPTRGSRGS